MTLRESRVTRQTLPICPVSTAGVGALVVTKTTDLISTAVGLRLVDGLTERNPIAQTIVHRFGIVGLLGASVLGVVTVVVVVEWLATIIETDDTHDVPPAVLYGISYVPLSVLYALVTVHNTVLVLSAA